MISLKYFTPLVYPSRYVNRLQVAKMAAAFSRDTDFCLFVERYGTEKTLVFETYGVEPFCLEETGSIPAWPKSFFLALRYRRIVAHENEPCVFYCRDIPLAFWLTFVSRRFSSRFFFELHSLTRFPVWMRRRIFQCAKGIITTNHAKADVLIREYGLPNSKVLVAPNGVDLSEFDEPGEDILTRYGVGGDLPTVLYVGTFSTEYGSELLERLAERLRGVAHVVAIGGTITETQGGALIRIPHVSHREVVRAVMHANVLVAPYTKGTERNERYRSPIKIREYMASGVPMVVPRLSAIEEIVNEEEAYMHDPGSVENLAEKIRRVFSMPQEAQEKARRARRRAEMFTWEKRAERIIDFITSRI